MYHRGRRRKAGHWKAGLAVLSLLLAAPVAATTFSTGPFAFSGPETLWLPIPVSGLADARSLSLTIEGFSHDDPDGLVLGLANQQAGLGIILLSGAGSDVPVEGLTLTFSDGATRLASQTDFDVANPEPLASGTYLPSNFSSLALNAVFHDGKFTVLQQAGSLDALLAPDTLNGDWFFYLADLFPFEEGAIEGVHLTFSGAVTNPDGGDGGSGPLPGGDIPGDGGTPGHGAVSGVPEPATWAFLLLGFGLVGLGVRRASLQQA